LLKSTTQHILKEDGVGGGAAVWGEEEVLDERLEGLWQTALDAEEFHLPGNPCCRVQYFSTFRASNTITLQVQSHSAMIRILFLLLAWFVAVPAFSQGKPTSPSTQEQLLELRLEQQHLKEKLDDQKASLEEKFEVKKENLSNERGLVEWWLSALGVLVTFVGVVLPIVGFIYGKKAYADIKKQKVAVDADLLKLNSWMDEKRKEIEEKCKLMDDWMNGKKKKIEEGLNELGDVASKQVSKSDASSSENIEFSNKAKEIEQSNDATPFQKAMAKALELYFAGNYGESIKQHLLILNEYKSELTLEHLPTIYSRLAYSYDVLGDSDNSIKYYEKSLTLDPSSHVTWINLGLAYNSKGDYDTAIDKYNEAIRLKPYSVDAWNNLGIAYNRKGDSDTAIDKYNEAIRLKPDDAEVWYNLGVAFYDKGDSDTAIDKYNKAIRLKPDFDDAWYNLGLAYSNLGEYDTAILKYNEAVRLKPDHSLALTNLAELLIIQNEDVVEILSKLRAAVKMKGDGFDHLLLETIMKVKTKTYIGTCDDAFEQIRHTVGNDVSKVDWDFKQLNGWLSREETNPLAPDKETKEFVTDLIRQIEEWRDSQPKAE
jgi:tetratricopeptide (TPR) repeat protein